MGPTFEQTSVGYLHPTKADSNMVKLNVIFVSEVLDRDLHFKDMLDIRLTRSAAVHGNLPPITYIGVQSL